MQGSARKDVVFGAAGVYPVTVPGPKWKSWLSSRFPWSHWIGRVTSLLMRFPLCRTTAAGPLPGTFSGISMFT